MQFHASNVLSDFDARFDDAMLRRPFIGRRQGDHGSRGRVSPENSPGHPANAPGGGVDTGDHDGDEKYGSDASSSSSSRGKVSPENSPGHPANAPGGSTGSTGPGAGGPSVGDGGGGVDTGSVSSPSNDNSPGHPANAPGGSSSRSRVSPENSPGHPANAPTTGGTTGSDDDDTGGGNSNFDSPNLQTGRNDVDSDGDGVTDHVVMVQEDGIERWYAADDRYREGYATGEYRLVRTRDDGTRVEAQVDDEGRFRSEQTYGASTYEDGTTVTHRDTTGDGRADAMVANRPDGSVEIIRDSDGDGAADQVMVEDASGLVHIYSAEEWAKERQRRGEFSGEETGKVTQANSEAAWDAHKPTIDRALAALNDGGTPDALKAAAAEVARIASAWRGSGVAADDGGLMADHLDGLAQSLSESSQITQANYEQRAEFEKAFRQITKREPSGDLVKDADILSRYDENPLTDMGYAAEVRQFEKTFREVTGREPSGDLARDADILSRYGENPLTDMGYAAEVRQFEKTFREVTGREPSGDLARDADILSRYGENPLTDMGYAAIVQAQKEERERQEMVLPGETGVIGDQVNIDPVTGALQVSPGVMPAVAASQAEERERRVAHLESKFRDEVLQIGEAPGGFVENVLDSQIEGGGLPTNHPDFPEYDQLRTEMDGPHWRREQIASATQQLLDDSTIGTIDIGSAKDAISALVTGRHVSNYDSSIPVPVNAGVLPVIGTLADANIRGADGYNRGDVAWLAGMGALDVLPIPGVGTLARTSKGAIVVIRNLPAAGEIATGGRRTLASVTQGTLKAPYQLAGTRPKPQGVSNIPVHMGGEVVVDGQRVPAWEGLLRQRDEALQQYRQTGMPQSIDLPTADGGIQTVWVGGSRAATSYGTGGMVHTSPMAGLLTELSQTPEGFVGKVKVGKSGQKLPDVEQRHYLTTQGVPAFREGSAFNKTLYEDPNFSPGYQTLVDPRNLADVEHVRKVFGGDVDTGVIKPSAVVELEGGVPKSKVIAGGPDKPPLYQEYPVGLQKTRGITEHMYVDVPPDMKAGRWEVFRDNVLAEVDRLRGRTETFYVAHQNADGTIGVLRKADMDALAAEGVSLDDVLRVRTRTGETRFIARSQWDSAVRRFSTGATRGNDERHDFKNAQERGLDNRDNFGAGVRTPNGNRPVDSVDVGGRSNGRYSLGGDGPFRISAPAPTVRLSGIARPTPSPIPTMEPQPDPRIPDARIPDARVPDPLIPDARIPDARVPDPLIPDPRIPDPRVPDARVPDPLTPDARVRDPLIPDPRIPDIGTPDLTRQRRVRLPEVDEAPMTVVKAEEGLYPRVVAHDELIRVYHDLDTGEVRTEPLAMPTEPIIVKHDDTPPPIESRFAGHRKITPRGGYVFTKPVGERRRKASSKRHPYLRKGELRGR